MTNVHIAPDLITRLQQMSDAAAFEAAGDSPMSEPKPSTASGSAAGGNATVGNPARARTREVSGKFQARSLADCISNVSTPTGKKPILKTMLTTACERNCNYCPFRAGRARTKRVTISPDEMAMALDTMSRAGQVQGMFLSSGIIKGSVTTQDKIIDTAEIVRRTYKYRGYLHLKIMPGAEYEHS